MQQEWEKIAIDLLVQRHGKTKEEATKIITKSRSHFSNINGWEFVKMLKEHGKDK